MPNIDVSGLVLREVKYGENSRIITVLGKDIGKVSVLASRARTNKSGLLTATQLMAFSNFNLFKGRDGSLLKLNDAEAVCTFDKIRTSLEKMAYASYFCDIASHITREGVSENNILSLLLNCLYLLNRDDLSDEKAKKIQAVYQIKALSEAGFAPSCSGCVGCGSEDVRYFSRMGGVFYCKKCSEGVAMLSEINKAIYNAIDYIVRSEIKHVMAFEISSAAISYLSDIGEEYLKFQMDKEFKTLSYLKNVLSL